MTLDIKLKEYIFSYHDYFVLSIGFQAWCQFIY